jgi:hypothetical protein
MRTSQSTLDLVADFLAPFLAKDGLDEGPGARRSARFLARMVLSYISSPGRWDLTDPEEVRRLVECELMASVRGAAR